MGLDLFISDLHLHPEQPQITATLEQLLRDWKGRAERLFILGDFFEVWLGDDIHDPLSKTVSAYLKDFAAHGSEVLIMHGNRDFLIGTDFAARCGARLISDPYLTTVAGKRCLLMHGDTLCTEDEAYLNFRQMVRDPQWQQAFLAKSVHERIAFARDARAQSQADAVMKSDAILDVTPAEVVRVIEKNAAELMIHGHTHRPARHTVATAQGNVERIVLGDWHSQGWVLIANDHSLQLETIPFSN